VFWDCRGCGSEFSLNQFQDWLDEALEQTLANVRLDRL